jgi:D-alanyl-D-alanine endopeptidase (penicillin-binding protein 7)
VSSQDVSAVEKPSVSQNTSSQCSVTASIFLVRDVTNGKNIISQDIHHRWPIASISKLMTVLIAYHYMDSKEVVSITKAMRDSAQGYASLEVGASYSVNDLIRAALVVSSNDAAYALSEIFGYDAFIAKMNEEAKIIGMTDTSFFEPSGLSYLNQSTASDISLLLNYLYKSAPELLATTRKQTVLLYDYAHRKNVSLSNIDYFAGTEGFIGGKTGFINESGGNLATLFNEGSSVWAVEVFGSSDRFGDIQKLLKCAHNL